MDDELLFFNGIDGATGSYLVPPLAPSQVSALALGQSLDPDELAQLQLRAFELQNPHAGVEADARDLSQTGWGVIFAHDADPAIKEALSPLLQHRLNQAGAFYKEYTGPLGYRRGESKVDFLVRHGVGPGPVIPDQVPYYLLLVGDPDTIPYRFQVQLDVQYAVGRIHFDTLEEYDQYARSVVASESGLSLPPRSAFFGVANEADRATNLSLENLVQPLSQKIVDNGSNWAGGAASWEVQNIYKTDATKASLSEILNGDQAPALFFSASHGIGFPNGDAHQLPHQGSLICQDWPGPQAWRGPLKEDFYFSADDLSSDSNLMGMIAFFFACYGAGTPKYDEFAAQLWQGQPGRREIAPQAFLARLPTRMLSLPRGGALAVIGHVERAWGSSFFWGQAGKQVRVFEDYLERLIKGHYPVGYAVEVFNNRYAEISTDLSSRIEDARFGMKPNDMELANLWTANNDARNYVVLGDPAVRLPVGGTGKQERASLDSLVARSPEKTKAAPVAFQAPPADQGVTGPAPVAAPAPAFEVQSDAQIQQGAITDPFALRDALRGVLTRALQGSGDLEVATYTSPDLAGVQQVSGGSPLEAFPGSKLAILTRLLADGSMQMVVAEGAAKNEDLLKTHQEMVAQALSHRDAVLQAAATVSTP